MWRWEENKSHFCFHSIILLKLSRGTPLHLVHFCRRYSTQYICFIENGRRPYNIKALTILEHFLRCVLQTQYNINESLRFPILLELDIPGASYPDGDGSQLRAILLLLLNFTQHSKNNIKKITRRYSWQRGRRGIDNHKMQLTDDSFCVWV